MVSSDPPILDWNLIKMTIESESLSMIKVDIDSIT